MSDELVGELEAQRRREEFQRALEDKARAYARAVRAECDLLEGGEAWKDIAETEARLEATLREVDKLRERLHRADGMANEVNTLVRENRQLRTALVAIRSHAQSLPRTATADIISHLADEALATGKGTP